MSERANYIYSVGDLARRIVSRRPATRPGFHLRTSPFETESIKRKINLWSNRSFFKFQRRINQKEYLLGVQNFEYLLILLAADDRFISDLKISDKELRNSLKRSIDFKMVSIVNRVKTIMEKSPRYYDRKRKLRALADRFGELQELRRDLFATHSNLSRS